ncbi:MAG TPA: MFS transporter [Actinomycetota bacterium]|nr:MFS transporter [Actinomycetota bacterium]
MRAERRRPPLPPAPEGPPGSRRDVPGETSGSRRAGVVHGARRAIGAALIPDTATGRGLAVMAAVDAVGTGLFLTSAALYFTRTVGLSSAQVGIGLTAGGLAGLAGAVPLGALADRVGAGRVFIGAQFLRGIGFLVYCLVGSFLPFLAVAGALGVLETITPPLTVAIVGAAVPPEVRVQTMARLRAVRNVAFGAGALVATAVIESGSRTAFLTIIVVDAVTYFAVAAGMRHLGIDRLAPAVRSRRSPTRGRGIPGPRYLAAAVLDGVLSIHMTLLTVGLPLWIAGHTRAPLGIVGACVVVNTAIAAGFQARLSHTAADLAGAGRSMRRAGIALAACCLLALVASRVGAAGLAAAVLLAAAVALTLGEIWQSAGEWKISYDLADPENRARYLSAFQLGSGLQQVAGPAAITIFILPHPTGWVALGAVALLAGLAVGPLIDRAPVSEHARPPRLEEVTDAP